MIIARTAPASIETGTQIAAVAKTWVQLMDEERGMPTGMGRMPGRVGKVS